MRIFMTGASGFIGSAVVPELLSRGHRVLGLARSDASAQALKAAGADVWRGDLNDVASLRAGVAETEGVIHLGFIHDFDRYAEASQTDARAVAAMGDVLAGSGRPFVIASGALGTAPGRVATEETPFDPKVHPRAATAVSALELAKRGVRASVIRLSPTVHGEGDHGFIPFLIQTARQQGASGYIGEGNNRWTAVHRLDAAQLIRLAAEKAPAGSILHAVDDEAVTGKAIAQVIGQKLNLPVKSVPPEAAPAHFSWMARFFSMDQPVSSALTRERLGWKPTQPRLIADLEAGHYFV